MWSDFRKFISQGNVIELAVGFILATAFAAVVKGFVDWIVMPPIGKLLGGVDFAGLYINLDSKSYPSAAAALAANAPGIYYGAWINAIITFLIIALVMFLVVRAYNASRPAAEVKTKDCPYCLSAIPIGATRCPACTSQLEATPAPARV